MTTKSPIARTSVALPDHAAVRAWHEATDGIPPAAVELWRERSLHNAAIYRLTFDDPGKPAVFAKFARLAILAVERTVYQDVLPRLPLTAPRYLGDHETEDGFLWLFFEDVGDQCLSPVDPEHRVLASRWLGMLHRSGAGSAVAARLPDGGPGRYRAHLHAGGQKIRGSLGNRALGAEDRTVLDRVLDVQDRVASRWHTLEKACAGLPSTLVHGDFQPKNLRLRGGEKGPELCPIDWETAGWGVPAADLMGLGSPRPEARVDIEAYRDVVRERWPEFDAETIRRLSIMGLLFRTMAAIEWESEQLRFEDAQCLVRPILSMQIYTTWLTQGLEAGAEWLG